MSFSAKERNKILQEMSVTFFDLIVIGGGITGAGIALDASQRGLKVALVEMQDFASGTSGRSTKLIHGGLRYLKQMEFRLVAEVGRERKILHEWLPHLVKPEKMLLPIVKRGSLGKFTARLAMCIYEWLAKVKKEERHKFLNAEETLKVEPLLKTSGLLGSILFYEYKTDDARLTIEIMKKAVEGGATAINYVKAISFTYENDVVSGIKAQDVASGKEITIRANYVVNAGGPWVDEIDDLDKSHGKHKLQLTKGVHVVVDREKLPVCQSVYFDTFDRRMIFVIPRGKKTYIGTTDTFYNLDLTNPQITHEDSDYLLKCVNAFFPGCSISEKDIESGWAGLRPLVNKPGKGPSEISRKDEIFISKTGLITIAGGKLTGYRKMAERVTDFVAKQILKKEGRIISLCRTGEPELTEARKYYLKHIAPVKGYLEPKIEAEDGLTLLETQTLYHRFGYERLEVAKIFRKLKAPANSKIISFLPPLVLAQLIYCIENEMCTSPVDFFVRRTADIYFDIELVKKEWKNVFDYMRSYLDWNEKDSAHYLAEMQKELDRIEILKRK